jgi:hypothetical protein
MKQLSRIVVPVVLATLVLVVVVVGVRAGGILLWQPTGVPISTAPSGQFDPKAVSDGSGGAIIAWQDYRTGTNRDIYAQRVNSAGQVQWATDGVPVSTASGDQQAPAIASDGQGGAIIVWQDKRNGTDFNIYAQRVLSTGISLWNTNGITICSAVGIQDYPQIASDGQGGAIIVWEDNRSGDHYDVYAQRVSANGTVLWTSNGVSLNDVMPFPQSPPYPTIMNDGDEGAYIAWAHSENFSVYARAQHVLSDGVPIWNSGGITVGLSQGAYPTLASDGDKGAIVAWGSSSFYAQHVLPNGTLAWGTNGITLNIGYGANLFLVEDGLHGAYAAWQRYNTGYTNSRVLVQHVLSDSTLGWGADGVTMTSMSGLQQVPRLVNDGFGSVIAVWQTASDTSGTDYSIWSQRLDPTGASQWNVDGIQVISRTAYQMHSAVASDLSHGAIVVWEDQRSGGAADIFAQRIYDFTPTAWVYLPMIRK